MKFQQKSNVLIVLLSALCSLAVAKPAMAGTLLLNGTWNYSDNDEGKDDFTQGYSANYSGNAQLTELIRLTGNIRYSRFIADTTSDRLTPSLSLSNFNDIYTLNLSGNYYITRQDDFQTDTWNWNSYIQSAWTQRWFLPTLSAFYGQSGRFDDRREGYRNDRTGATVAYSYWQWLTMGYTITWNKSENKDNQYESENLNQAANLYMSQDFFNNRLGLSFSQTYAQTDTDINTQIEEGGFALVPVILSQASYEETDDPLTGPLTNDASFLLSDDDQPPTTLVIDPLNDPVNLGIKPDFQEINAMYLTTKDDIALYANSFGWDLYSSSNGTDWQLLEANILFSYDSQEQRFEFEIEEELHRYLKLVADTTALTPLQVTEIEGIEVFRKVFEKTESRQNTSQLTNFSANYNITSRLRFNYSFSYDKREDDTAPERENTGNQGSLSWNASRYFTARLNASRYEQQVDGLTDSVNKIYSLSFSSSPLDTLSVSLGASRYEDNPADSALETIRHSYNLYTTAQLYQDLDASLSLNYSTIEKGRGNDSFGSNLRLAARLRPTLLLTYDNSYNKNLDTDSYTVGNNLGLNWRISQLLNINSSLGVDWAKDQDTTTAFNINVGLTPNAKNRITAGYTYINDEETDNLYRLKWSWIITRVFTFQLSGNYFDGADDSSWNINAQLSASYRNE